MPPPNGEAVKGEAENGEAERRPDSVSIVPPPVSFPPAGSCELLAPQLTADGASAFAPASSLTAEADPGTEDGVDARESAPPKPPNEHCTAPRLAGRAPPMTPPPASSGLGAKSSWSDCPAPDGKSAAAGAAGGGRIGGGVGPRPLCSACSDAHGASAGCTDDGRDDGRITGVEPEPVVGAGLGAAEPRPCEAAEPDRDLVARGVVEGAARLTIRLIFCSVSSDCGAGLIAEKGEAERRLLCCTKGVVSARAVDEPAVAAGRALEEASQKKAPPREEPGRPPKGKLVNEMRREKSDAERPRLGGGTMA
jgi:hypothetical protein